MGMLLRLNNGVPISERLNVMSVGNHHPQKLTTTPGGATAGERIAQANTDIAQEGGTPHHASI